MATSLLDLLGVLMIGLVGVLAAISTSGSAVPAGVETAASLIGLEGASPETLTAVAGLLAAVSLILKSVLATIIMRRVLRFLANRGAELSARLCASFLSQPILDVQSRASQLTSYSLSNGVNAAIVGILGSAIIALTEVTLLVLLCGALLLIDPIITIVAVAYFGLVGLLQQRWLGRWAQRVGEAQAAAEVASQTTIQDAIASYRELYVANRRALVRDRYKGLRFDAAGAMGDAQFISQVPKYLLEAALVFGAAVLTVTLLLTQDLTAAVGTLALFLAAGSRVMPSILRLNGALTAIRIASPAASRTHELVDSLRPDPQPISDLPPPIQLRNQIASGSPDFSPAVKISGVFFEYPGASIASLRDISVEVPAGSALALVGATGAGKSTLADVILGVLQPDAGIVTIGGLSPAEAVVRWPGGIGYVPQEVALSLGTVRQNVALALPTESIDDERVWEALRRAHLAEFLEESREGLDTVIGERGVRLSGGQRQRLGIARALYTRPQLLVLDEATSALDAETEQAIAETFRSLAGEVTTVTVAHRLATIRHADMVLYLDHGCIAARGTFAEVREAVPSFERQAKLLGL